MADEIAVGVPNAETETTVTPEVSTPAIPKVGEEQEPQGTETEGELEEHERKRKGGWQRKIERLETEKEFLMQELIRRGGGAQEPKPVVEESPSVEAKSEPKPQDFDLGDGTYDIVKFNKAHFAWLKSEDIRQTEAAKKAESTKSEEKRIFDSWIASRDKAAEKYSDMEEVLQVPVIPDSKAQPEKYRFVSREIMSSPFAGELAYYLGKHPEEAFALWEKSDNEIIRGLGRIEAQFARAESAEDAKPQEAVIPPPTNAPKPGLPIKRTSNVSAPDINDPKLSYKEFVKLREKQIAEKSKR